MYIIHKVLLTNNMSVSAGTQVLQIIKNNIVDSVMCWIEKNRIIPNLPIKKGHKYQFVLIASLTLMGIITVLGGTKQAVGATTPVVTNGVKWHPGHYYAIMNHGKDSSAYLSKVYKELQETPALRGIQISYSWPELEGAEGEYNFSSIAKRLSELSAINKRLVIVIDIKSSLGNLVKDGERTVPDYLRTAMSEGGEFACGGPDHLGWNIKLWNPFVHERIIALVRALGQHFNSNPHFEGIGLSETAITDPILPLTAIQKNNYYANLLSVQKQMRNYFPNTLTFQFISYPRSILESFTQNLNEIGSGLGGTNVYPEYLISLYPIYPPNVSSYFQKYSGIMPIIQLVRQSNYENTRADRTGYEPTVYELLSYARNSLKANYIFWTRHPDYYRNVLEMLNMKAQKSTPSGGLNPNCPSVYSSCVN